MEWNPYSIPPIFQFKELLVLQGGDPTISGLNVSIVGLGGCLVLGDASLLSVWSLNPLFVQADDLADNLLIGSGLIELRQSKPRPTIETVLNEIALVPRFGLSISQRLRVLCLQQAEDPDSAGISIESMESFLAFLRSVQDLRLPSLSLTPDGNIYSSWRDHDRVLSAEFLSNTTARYVLFRPAPGGAGQKLRSAGSAPANQLLSIPETSAATWVLL
jgi:hypothetical protein